MTEDFHNVCPLAFYSNSGVPKCIAYRSLELAGPKGEPANTSGLEEFAEGTWKQRLASAVSSLGARIFAGRILGSHV